MNNPDEIFIFFTSKFSNSCKQLQDKINFITPHFNTYLVDIDNPQIRYSIVNATKNKIQSVPAIMLLYPNTGIVQTKEGPEVVRMIDQAVGMVQQKLQILQQQELEKQQLEKQKSEERFTQPISEIHEKPVLNSRRHTSISNIIDPETVKPNQRGGYEDDEIFDDIQEDEYYPPVKQSKKIGKRTIFPDKRMPSGDDSELDFGPPQPHNDVDDYEQEMAADMDRNKSYPPRAAPRIEEEEIMDQPVINKKAKNIGSKKKVKFIDEDMGAQLLDNTDSLEMDQIVPSGSGARPSQAKMKKSSDLKQSAEALMAARNELIDREEGPVKRVKASAIAQFE